MTVTIWGILGLPDANRTVDSIGQPVVYDAIRRLTNAQNAAVEQAISVFVGPTVTDPEANFATPGGGRMADADRLTRPAATKVIGRYAVGYPLRDYREQIAGDDITFAYMTLQQIQVHVDNMFLRYLNTKRYYILKAFLNNANYTYEDETLSQRLIAVKRLANTDGTIYAPLQTGTADGADDNHYLVSGYVASAISNTNNPFVTTKAEIEEHAGMGNLVAFINSAQQGVVEALSSFVPYTDPLINYPATATTISGQAPAVPGVVIGRVNRHWVSVWDYVPATYMIVVDLDQPRILAKRVDAVPVAGRGMLELYARQQELPLQEAFWRCREGFGVQNRLGAVVMQFKASGSYDIPTGYALTDA